VYVKTKNGVIAGIEMDNYRVFLGIPYAEPPVGLNRWKAPQPKLPWFPNILNATEFSLSCPQPTCERIGDQCSMSEDCLYLNVWAPTESVVSNASVPVMVFFFGGGFEEGSTRFPVFVGDWFANTSSLVVVTFNYRVGALGWLVCGSFEGNFGLQDQRLVLQWVQENIQAFGGNPSMVTAFGQSAGAASIATHMTSPKSQGLFHRAIMESNPLSMQFRSLSTSKTLGDIFAYWIGCSTDDQACFRSKTWQEVLAAQANTYYIPYTYILDELPWQPTLDDNEVIGQPLQLMAAGKVANISVVIGDVGNEMLSFIYGATSSPINSIEYDALLVTLFPLHFATILGLYPAGDDPKATLSMLLSDFFFICPNWRAVTSLAKSGMTTYWYQFMHAPLRDPENNTTYCRNKSCHGAELQYVWHITMPECSFTPEESNLSWSMHNAWAEFAISGVPSSDWLSCVSTNVTASMDFNLPQSKMVFGYRQQFCEYWSSLGYWK